MPESLHKLWNSLSALAGLVPDPVWTAIGAMIPVIVAAHFAIRKVGHERRFDKNLDIYSRLHRATDRVAVYAPGSDKIKEHDDVAAKALSDMIDAYDEAKLHISPRSRVALENLFEQLRVLWADAQDEQSPTSNLSNRRANLLLHELPEQIIILGRRDLYGGESLRNLNFRLFWRRDRKRILGVFQKVWEDPLKTPVPLD